eukprot:137675-Alexandrium_andersonii.AAC.1
MQPCASTRATTHARTHARTLARCHEGPLQSHPRLPSGVSGGLRSTAFERSVARCGVRSLFPAARRPGA